MPPSRVGEPTLDPPHDPGSVDTMGGQDEHNHARALSSPFSMSGLSPTHSVLPCLTALRQLHGYVVHQPAGWHQVTLPLFLSLFAFGTGA